MKKLLLRNIEQFRSWQFELCRKVDCGAQHAINTMASPEHYPVVLVWLLYETTDMKHGNFQATDQLDYCYVYIDTFPVKELKRGMYVYQVARTSEGLDAWMEH